MKKLILSLILTAALLLLICPASLAYSDHELPQEIRDYFSADRFAGATVLDRADLTGYGPDDCWFVLIRTKSGENVLYQFRQKNGAWTEQFHTGDAVPQTKHGVRIDLAGSGGEEGFAGFTFSKPHLYIGQENDEGEYWELTVIFELQNSRWMLHRIWSYTGYDNMLIKDDRIVYYTDIESATVAGTAMGTLQRDLRYASLPAVPKTLSEARAKLTAAPELPESSQLTVWPVSFTGKQKYDVYSAPDKNALRGGNSKAKVSTNGWIQVFGTEGGWVLIQYSIDAQHYRFGYISDRSLPKNADVPELGFIRTDAFAASDLSVTDDPLYSRTELFTVAEGSHVYLLATLGDWAYIERIGDQPARGFVPAAALRVNADEDPPYAWSDPAGTYLANLLAPVREIRNEEEARAYAEELHALMSAGPLPEGTWEIRTDHHDESWHCSVFDENMTELYGAGFLSNGVIQHLFCPGPDPRLITEGVRKDGSALDAGRWAEAKRQIAEWVEKTSPGILALAEPLHLNTVIDSGNVQCLLVDAMPLDPELSGSINIIAVLYEDGHCEIMDYSCYGAG